MENTGKKSTIFFILAAIFLTILVFGIRFLIEYQSNSKQDNPLIITGTKEPDLLDLNSGPKIGTKMPSMKGVTINGIEGEISFRVDEKRKVLFFMPIPETCRKCTKEAYNQINYLSSLIGEKFDCYLLYNQAAPARQKIPLASDSKAIIVGKVEPYNSQLKNISPRIFLVEGDGTIKYFMDMPQGNIRWPEVRQAVIRFAQTGMVPEGGSKIFHDNLNLN